jgi:predicted component of type VI protein secretion system
MAADIVQRLRDRPGFDEDMALTSERLMIEAADKIERLWAALTVARQHLDDNTPDAIVAQIDAEIGHQQSTRTEK